MAVTASEGERIHQVEMHLSELKGAYQHLATKADVAETKVEIAATKADIAETRAELKTDIAETRAELKTDISETRAELKTDIAEIRGELRLMKWFMGLTLAAVVYPLLERIWM